MKSTLPVIPENEILEKFIHSHGPGGQNVNKVATAVQLRFDLKNSPSISVFVKNRLRQIAKHLVTNDGILIIEVSTHRMQSRNREEARNRLKSLLLEAAKPLPPKRRKTKPTKGSVERRLKAKTGRGNLKKLRGKVFDD